MGLVTALKFTLGVLAFYYVCSSKPTKRIDLEDQRSREEAQNLSQTINNILKHYDKKLRPNAGGKAVDVVVEAKVVAFGELKEASMEFAMDIFFRQWWYDPRFAHDFSMPFTMAYDATKIFWTPDTYFVNVKSSKYHHVTRDNMRVMINPDGKIYFSTRITLTAQCDMDFRLYPMDTQTCPLIIESYAYTAAEVNYTWREKKTSHGIEIVSQEMAQFDLLGVKTKTKDTKSSSFASLRAEFTFKRRLEFFIFSVFTPAVILVILSWCCFWISRQAVPARVSLGITTILTTILLSGSVNQNMPKVSYMKSIDYMLLTNFGFIFLSFIEYVFVLNTNPEPKWWKMLRNRLSHAGNNSKEVPAPLSVPSKCGLDTDDSHVHVHALDKTGESHDVATVVLPREHQKEPAIVVVTSQVGEPTTITRQRKSDIHIHRVHREPKKKPEPAPPNVHWVDVMSRIMFPTAYFLFLAWYWYSNLNASQIKP